MLLKKVVLIGIFLILLLNLASAQYYYDQSFDYGFSGVGGLDDVLYVYEIYSGWVDFFLFLLIFLGLTQAVFEGSHLRSQQKSLSIGISLALSFALVSWERYNGINLLSFGPIALLIFLLLLYYVIFEFLRKIGTGPWAAGAISYVIAYITLMIFGGNYLSSLVDYAGGLFQLLNILFWISLFIGVLGFLSRRAPPPAVPRGLLK